MREFLENGVSLIIPAYHESENLELILPKVKEALSNLSCPFEILIVDTVKPVDNTKEICEKFEAEYVVRRGGNCYGDAIRTGIEAVKFSKTIIMDADGSHDPSDICRLYEKSKEGFDIVIGSRYAEGGGTDNNFILKFMSYMVNLTFRVLFCLNIKDVSNSYRIYNSNMLKNLRTECNNFDLVEEILIKLIYTEKNLKVAEIPIYFNKRMLGNSKRELFVFILSYFKTLYRLMKFASNK